MSGRADLGLSTRLLVREWRAGELRVLVLALIIAVLVSTAISFFTDRLQRGMVSRAAEFLGADLVVSGRAPLPEQYLQQAQERGLEHSEVVEFSSVVASESDMLLASIKALSPGYPLRGEVRTAPDLFATEQRAEGIPPAGEVWVEARILSALQLEPGDLLEVGMTSLRVGAVLTHEPDRAGDFYALNARVLMNLDDLEAAGVIQPAAGCAIGCCSPVTRAQATPFGSGLSHGCRTTSASPA